MYVCMYLCISIWMPACLYVCAVITGPLVVLPFGSKKFCRLARRSSHLAHHTVGMGVFCAGDYNRDIKIQVFDFDQNSKHDLIGEVHTSLQQMLSLPSLELINDKKRHKGAGELRVSDRRTKACSCNLCFFLESS